jgi:dsRNA-specific ribonuclease
MDNPNNQLANREKIENILNYFENIGDNNTKLKINNLEYYQRAFVHESYYQSVQNTVINKFLDVEKTYLHYIPCESNERLEYLGDHILKAIMGKYLFTRFDQEREGFLTKLKIKIEKCSMLHQFGLTLGFKNLLLLSLQVENQTILDLDRGRNTPSYYEDAFEAFIGAIMLDFNERGYIYAERFVISVIENVIDFAEIISKNDNFKDSLQRYFQSLKWKTPIYTSLNEEGPLYRTVFTRMLTINKENFDQLDNSVKNTIIIYTQKILEHYKTTQPEIFTKLFNTSQNEFILGIGFGRKVINAEQDCAKQSLLNLNLDLNF